jgi:hypothetical protein
LINPLSTSGAAVTSEQLQSAVDSIVREKLDHVYSSMEAMNQRITANSTDVKALAEEVGSIKEDLGTVKTAVSDVKVIIIVFLIV